ncbi:type I site-specific deoxyribonuclease, HsdR family protein [Candidatus Haloredivivus sp. G17]|nr:type I site-specific deoxyribonuclease, HsdR family protein [Candidatus Haloredivivus sp. G17]
MISENAGETITTLIQKFRRDDDEEKFPLLSNDEDIYVMVDEAHRTQYDELANNMRTALPNAFYVGFTGTPIEKDKRNTKRTFGNYIDKYTIDQSIEDEVTVPILYQGRLADIHLEGRNLDDIFVQELDRKIEKGPHATRKFYQDYSDNLSDTLDEDELNEISKEISDRDNEYLNEKRS